MSSFFTNISTTPLETALDYASKGFPVFPSLMMGEDGRNKPKPICQMGFRAATTDPNTIKDWWNSFPEAMISIPTGKASGLLVFSVNNALQGGQEKWEKFAAETGIDLEAACCQKTPSGRDYIFKFPVQEGKTPGCKALCDGIQVLGEGGSFVVAPSFFKVERGMGKYEEGKYAVVNNTELVELPKQAVERILTLGTVEDSCTGINAVIKRLKAKPVEEITMPEPEEEVEQEEEEEKYAEELPALPLEALPPKLRKVIKHAAQSFCVDEWIPFAAALKTASMSVGANIMLKHKYLSPGNIWLCLVAEPSSGKSQIVKFFKRPLQKREKNYCDIHSVRMEYWNDEMKEYEGRKSEAIKKGDKFNEAKPEQPVGTRIYVKDITPESLARVLADNPGGVAWETDEIRELLNSFGRYGGKGAGDSAKSKILGLYSGDELKVDRKVTGVNEHVDDAYLSIFGGTQPGILPRIFEKDDMSSGFLQRFTFIVGRETAPIDEASIPEIEACSREVEEIFGELEDQIQRLAPIPNGKEKELEHQDKAKAKILKLTPEGLADLQEFCGEIRKKAYYFAGDGEEASHFKSMSSRWREQLPRLILLMHCLDAVEKGYSVDTGYVHNEIVKNSIKIFQAMMSHSEYAWEKIKGTAKAQAPKTDILKIIDKYIQRGEKTCEIHYAETTETGQKIAEAILTDLGAGGGTTKTKQALSKCLIAIGFEKGKTVKGQKYTIKKELYEKALEALNKKPI